MLLLGCVALEVLHPALGVGVVAPHPLVQAVDEVLDELAEGPEHRVLELRALGEVDRPDWRRGILGDVAFAGDPRATGVAADRPPTRMPELICIQPRPGGGGGRDLPELPIFGRRLLDGDVLVVRAADRAL